MRNRVAAFIVCCLPIFCAAQQKTEITPERVNAALAQLDPYIRSEPWTKTKVPGAAVAVIYNDQVVFLRGYGVRKVGEPEKIDPDTVFELASVSKPIASTILASLVGHGKISWDDRIADLEPGFQLSSPETTREVTIRDFLSHRSGLATESGDLLEDLGYSRPDILYRMRYLPLPGHVSQDIRLQQLWLHHRSHRRRHKDWQALGDDRGRAALCASRHDIDQFALLRLRKPHEQSGAAHHAAMVNRSIGLCARPTRKRPPAE